MPEAGVDGADVEGAGVVGAGETGWVCAEAVGATHAIADSRMPIAL